MRGQVIASLFHMLLRNNLNNSAAILVFIKMEKLPRAYTAMIDESLHEHRQMAFVAGPRQVGKTTTCRDLGSVYLDWDNEDHRTLILGGIGVGAESGSDQV